MELKNISYFDGNQIYEGEDDFLNEGVKKLEKQKEKYGTILEDSYQVKYARIIKKLSEKLDITLEEAFLTFLNHPIYDNVKRDSSLVVDQVVEYILEDIGGNF